MEAYRKLVIVALVVIVVIGNEPMAANGAIGSSQSICGMSVDGLMSCKAWVTMGSPNSQPPSAACCSALSGADLRCMCSFKNSKMLPTLGIDPKLAMQLPLKCNLVQSIPC